jgi:hypothetical protein
MARRPRSVTAGHADSANAAFQPRRGNNKGGQTHEKGNDYRFLRQNDAEYALELELHLVMDNYGTHRTGQVKRRLKRHPRFKLHFVATSSSWLNMAER